MVSIEFKKGNKTKNKKTQNIQFRDFYLPIMSRRNVNTTLVYSFLIYSVFNFIYLGLLTSDFHFIFDFKEHHRKSP